MNIFAKVILAIVLLGVLIKLVLIGGSDAAIIFVILAVFIPFLSNYLIDKLDQYLKQ